MNVPLLTITRHRSGKHIAHVLTLPELHGTGIGFIGGGAILKSDSQDSGTTTAAGLWATGAIGLAVAGGRYEIAILISTVTFITFALFKPVKSKLHHED